MLSDRIRSALRSLALLGATLALAVCACAQQAAPARPELPLRAPEIQRIVERGELVVAMNAADSPPFFQSAADGNPSGLDVDLAREIGRELGVRVRFDRRAKSFNEVVVQVSRGQADIGIGKLSRTLARAQSVLFTQPYLTLHHALLLNRVRFAEIARGRSTQATLQHYPGSIAVLDHSSFQDFAARNFPQAAIRPFDTWDQAVQAVRNGQVSAAYRDEFEVRRVLARDPSSALHLSAVTVRDRVDTLGVAVDPRAPALLAWLDLLLAQRPQKLQVADLLKSVP